MSRNEAPVWGLRSDLYYCQAVAGLLMWGALSDERTDLSFTIAMALASALIFGSESRGTQDHILLSQIRDSPFRRLLFFFDEFLIIVGFSLYGLGTDHSTENTSVAQQWIHANHIEDTFCGTGSIVACVYCGFCLEIGRL
jgi:hypothetical protein